MAEKKEEETKENPVFRMQKMYTKDLSFENPNAPAVYITPQKLEPNVEINLKLNNSRIDDDHWEVTVQITAKISTKDDKKVMFIIEIEHAGVFLLKNIPEEHMQMILRVDCPTLLFPFTRQIVSQVSTDGGFAPFLMEPVNFMALFQNAKKEKGEVEN